MKKRVLHILDSLGYGGAETWMLSCVEHINKTNIAIEFDFLLTSGKQSELDQKFIELGVKIHYIEFSRSNLRNFIRNYRLLLQKENYDMLYNHQDFVSGFHFLIGFGLLPKIRVAHLHNPLNFVKNYSTTFSRKLNYYIGKYLMFLTSTSITGTSNACMDEYGYDKFPFKFKRKPPIHCGFDTTRYKYNELNRINLRKEFDIYPENFVVLFVGRISLDEFDTAPNQKNPEFAFRLAEFSKQNAHNIRYLFVGKTSEDVLNKYANDASEEYLHNTKFLGLRDDIHKFYSAADCLLFPSFWEGLGMVSVEAQISGLPVLCSDSIPLEADIYKDLVHRINLQNGVVLWHNALLDLEKKLNKFYKKKSK
jgi:glycosyltransferase involved in cell wall biosynthesis